MGDVASEPAGLEALERLRTQRERLADRIRAPWWYLAGIAVIYGLVFAFPVVTRYTGVSIWPFFVVATAVAYVLQWGWTRTTGIKIGFRNLRYPGAGRPVRIAIVVLTIGTIAAEHFLIDRGLTAVGIAVGCLAVVAEVVAQQAALRGIRQELRAGGGVA